MNCCSISLSAVVILRQKKMDLVSNLLLQSGASDAIVRDKDKLWYLKSEELLNQNITNLMVFKFYLLFMLYYRTLFNTYVFMGAEILLRPVKGRRNCFQRLEQNIKQQCQDE